MSAPIADHRYRPDRQGQWQTDRCDLCGEPHAAHADAWDEADYRRDGDQALTALAASIRDSREGGQEGTE